MFTLKFFSPPSGSYLNLGKVKQSGLRFWETQQLAGVEKFNFDEISRVTAVEMEETLKISRCFPLEDSCQTWTFFKDTEEIIVFSDSDGEYFIMK